MRQRLRYPSSERYFQASCDRVVAVLHADSLFVCRSARVLYDVANEGLILLGNRNSEQDNPALFIQVPIASRDSSVIANCSGLLLLDQGTTGIDPGFRNIADTNFHQIAATKFAFYYQIK